MRDAHGHKLKIGDFVMFVKNLDDLEPCEYEIVSLEPLMVRMAVLPGLREYAVKPGEIVLSQFV